VGETRCRRLHAGLCSPQILDRRLSVYEHMNDGWYWLWMVPMLLLWLAVLGGVVYAAVRLALQHAQKPSVRQ
jgi:hypothetical protein